MFRAIIVSISMLFASLGAHFVGLINHPSAPVRGSYVAEYAAHGAVERGEEGAGVPVPVPAPDPAPAAPAPPSVQDIIRSAFTPLGQDAVNWAERIAFCESTYNPNAVNPSSNAQGLFQFLPSTWAGTPFAGQSPFDPSANARAAAWLLQTYGASQWACRA